MLTTLAAVSESIRYGYTASASVEPIGPKFLRITDIVPDQISWDTVPHCRIDEQSEGRYRLLPGDIVVARTGATVGYAKLIREPVDSVFASYLVRFRIDQSKADPGFVGKIVESEAYKAFVRAQSGGAAQPNASAPVLGSFTFNLPSREKQERIFEVASAYDDLIDTNRRRLALLEQSARLLYREWFVHLRFPGHEHVKVVDGVPEGWERKRLVELAEMTMGQSPASRHYNVDGTGFPFHQGVTSFGARFVEHRMWCDIPGRMAQAGDILFSVRAPVGRLNVTLDQMVIGRGLAALRSREGHQSMLFYQLANHFFKEDMIGGGAIFASVTKKDLENQQLLQPTRQLAVEFDDLASDLDAQIQNLVRQNGKLRQARDLLLPRLMSGEITLMEPLEQP